VRHADPVAFACGERGAGVARTGRLGEPHTNTDAIGDTGTNSVREPVADTDADTDTDAVGNACAEGDDGSVHISRAPANDGVERRSKEGRVFQTWFTSWSSWALRLRRAGWGMRNLSEK
jgi:hypothetical protein